MPVLRRLQWPPRQPVALEIVLAEPDMRTRLRENVGRLKSGLRGLGLVADETPVPIVCLNLGTADSMQKIQEELKRGGILLAYMAAYAGLGREGALRLAVFATHTPEMIDELLDNLCRLL